MKIVLASSSRYRAGLLRRLVEDFDSDSPHIDESQRSGESGAELASRLAREKAAAVAARHPDALLIGSDQVALLHAGEVAEVMLGKPGNFERARQQLAACSGREVTFLTACCVLDSRSGRAVEFSNACRVQYRELSASKIDAYLRREQPYDCAGSIKTEGLGIALLSAQHGSDPTALVGLPLMQLAQVLEDFGYKIIY